MIKLTWARRGYGWFKFETEDFSRLKNPGVYAIWLEGSPGRYVRVGSGNIGERLATHQADTKILYYRRSGILRVTWATVLGKQRLGIERYLAETLQPLVGERFPDVVPLAASLPGPA